MPTRLAPISRRLLATTEVATNVSSVVLDFTALANGQAVDPTTKRILIRQVRHVFSSGTGATVNPRLSTTSSSNIRPLAAAPVAQGTDISLYEADSFVAELKSDQTLDWYPTTDSAVADGHCTLILYFEECAADGT